MLLWLSSEQIALTRHLPESSSWLHSTTERHSVNFPVEGNGERILQGVPKGGQSGSDRNIVARTSSLRGGLRESDELQGL